MSKSELTDLTLHLHHQTAAAIFVSDDGDSGNAIWLPKSQIEFTEPKNNINEVTMPTWLAKEKGLI